MISQNERVTNHERLFADCCSKTGHFRFAAVKVAVPNFHFGPFIRAPLNAVNRLLIGKTELKRKIAVWGVGVFKSRSDVK